MRDAARAQRIQERVHHGRGRPDAAGLADAFYANGIRLRGYLDEVELVVRRQVVGAPPAVMNAILDALRPRGITHLDMPATPRRVWEALQKANSGQRP